jgi:hypothetical protein
MNKFVVALATAVSLGLAIPAFAEEKNDAQVPAERMGKPEMGTHDRMVGHHHHYHHHTMRPETKPQ